MTGASIIIPVYNGIEFARTCVASVYDSRTNVPFEVIVVDNGSGPELGNWLAREQESRANFQVVHRDEPLGFARAVNEGALQASHETLVLLNSDTVVTDHWLDGLTDALLCDPRIGVVSPVTNSSGNPLQTDRRAESIGPRDAGRYAARIRERKELVYEPERITFFCVMIRRDLWKLLAGLEEGFEVGNSEDSDFCLRARLAGYRLVVARNVFVFHRGQATFRANGLDHEAWFTRNQLLYCERASGLARSLEPPNDPQKQSFPSLSVVVPAREDRIAYLGDSLASLANQTVRGFETIVVSPSRTEITNIVKTFDRRLQASTVFVDEARCDQSAALLNAGLAAASRKWIAYLPAGDIYYPFHIELLADRLQRSRARAAYVAWSAVVRSAEPGNASGHRRSVVTYGQTPGQLGLNDYPPLLCWMYSRADFPDMVFDESFREFADWQFILRLSKQAKTRYVPRVTCEHRMDRACPARDTRSVREAERLLRTFPAMRPWQQANHIQFLEAVQLGTAELFPLLAPHAPARPMGRDSSGDPSEKNKPVPARQFRQLAIRAARRGYRAVVPVRARQTINRRARRFLKLPPMLPAATKRLQTANKSLAAAILNTPWIPNPVDSPDIFLFSVVPWNHLVQRPHHFARGLALRGHRVFWVDLRLTPPELVDPKSSLRELEPGLFYTELPGTAATLYRLKWDRAVLDAMEMAVAHIRAAYGVHNAIQLVSRPKWGPLVFRLRDRYGWPVVYDCVDDTKAFAALNGHDGGDFEDEMAQRCDLLVACSRLLYEDRSKLNPRSIQILNAGDYDLFHSAASAGLLKHLPRPIVGYFGSFGDWLDLEWIAAAARRFPRWSFVYIGLSSLTPAAQERWKMVTSAPNIHVFPQADPPKLAAYLAEFDVCTMPKRNLPMTRIMNSVKVYEYLAAGKPVLVSDTPELRPLAEHGLIEMYSDHEHSFRILERVIQTASTPEQTTARMAFAARNTWSKRVDELIATFATLDHPQGTSISESTPEGGTLGARATLDQAR